ncbi:hypothetical protein GOBAR_DD00766 [Gossypium barbadense]|nr:hypothetical protein GOBAR_DD00766 [Gossypium barbadense]
MTKTIRTKIMLLIIKKKEEAEKIKEILCPKIKKKLNVNMKDSEHVVDLEENSCSCKNWDLIGIPCMHAVVVIHLKDEYPKTYVKTWLVKGPKQWEFVLDMLPILPHRLRRLLDRLTKVRRKEFDEPQTTERLTERGVEMRCSKCNILGHNKRSYRREVGQNIPVKRQKVGIHNQMVAPTQQEATQTH